MHLLFLGAFITFLIHNLGEVSLSLQAERQILSYRYPLLLVLDSLMQTAHDYQNLFPPAGAMIGIWTMDNLGSG
jgi:hypothetical protein